MTDYFNPVDERMLAIQPGEQPSLQGGSEPPNLVDRIGSVYNYQRAGYEWAYQIGVEDAVRENDKLVETAGFKLEPLFDITTFGRNIHAAGTEFQSIMVHNSPVAGPDERYQATSEFQKSVYSAFVKNKKTIASAKALRPDLPIKSYEELHAGVLEGIKQARTLDPRAGWFTDLAAGIIAGPVATLARTNPWWGPEAATLVAGGFGPTSLARIGISAAVGAAANVLPQLGGRETLRQAGVPLSNEDLVWSGLYGAIFGAGGQALGELAIGKAGRMASNDRYSWMSLSKRQAKSDLAFKDVLARGAPEPTPEPPPIPTPPLPMSRAVPGMTEEAVQAARATVSGRKYPTASPAEDILDAIAPTYAAKLRAAQDFDHTAKQLEVPNVAPQDLLPPTRLLESSAAVIPDIRANLGPAVSEAMTPAWRRASKGIESDAIGETNARMIDGDTWSKWDKIQASLKDAQEQLVTAVRFHTAAAAGKVSELNKLLNELHEKLLRAKTDAGRSRVAAEIDTLTKYHDEVAAVRPGGTRPEPIKGFNEITLAERVAELQAKRDELFPDLERSVARAAGVYGLPSAQRDALEDLLRPGAAERINSPWRWPKNHKRPKDRPKSPYEVNLLKGPTQEELFAQRQLELPQQTDPLATQGAKPNETPADTAIRVNELRRDELDEITGEQFLQASKQFIEANVKQAGEATAIAKPGQKLPVPEEPPMFLGLTKSQWDAAGGFEMDGQKMTLSEAVDHVSGELEAFKHFSTCAVRK